MIIYNKERQMGVKAVTVTFCGHRELYREDEVRSWLEESVRQAIAAGAGQFLLGGYGAFDRMAAKVVWDMKQTHPEIQSYLVLPYLDKKVDAAGYDGTIYPPLESVPKRYAITHRNRWMVDEADMVIAYVTHDWGGAAATLAYAVRRGKTTLEYIEKPNRSKK